MSKIGVLFGNRIRELRKAKHMSQEELAYKAAISPAHLGQIERAQKNPTLDTIYQIAAALDTPVSEIFQDLYSSDLCESSSTATASDKILIHVNRMSEQQKKEILRLIRIVEKFSIDAEK